MGEVRGMVLTGLSVGCSLAAGALGGWDYGLQTLVCCMVADYLTGMALAGVFHKSAKSGDGTLDSSVGFRGLCKKGAQLVLVLIAHRLDGLMGSDYVRMAVVFFLIANEGLSILENLGLMGVPYPAFLKAALAVMQERGDEGKNG